MNIINMSLLHKKLFESVFYFFPASFISPLPEKLNKLSEDAEEKKLSNSIIEFAKSCQSFGNLVIPLCLVKLSSSSILAKVSF